MKTSILKFPFLFLMVPLFLFTSCEDVIIRGEGDVVSRTRSSGSFEAIQIEDNFEVYLTQGPAKDILIESQENLLSLLTTEVKNNKLVIKYNRNRVKPKRIPKIYITTPNLTELSVSGANTVRSTTDWQVPKIKINASGSGNIVFTLKGATKVESNITGSANITLIGDTDHYNLDITGSGKINAFELKSKSTDAEIIGSGKCDISVTDQLDAKISGSGRIHYKGTPAVNTQIAGSGSVRQVD